MKRKGLVICLAFIWVTACIVTAFGEEQKPIVYHFKTNGPAGWLEAPFAAFSKTLSRGAPLKGHWTITTEGDIRNQGGGMLLAGAETWEDYTLAFDVITIAAVTPYPWPGVIFRYIDDQNFVYLTFSPKEDYWRLFSCVAGKAYLVGAAKGFPLGIGQKGRISLSVGERTITCMLNTQQVFALNPACPLPPCGKIGFIGYPETDVEFSNIQTTLHPVNKARQFSECPIGTNAVVSCHENGADVAVVPGNSVEPAEQGVKLHYNFRTPGHDAAMLTEKIDVAEAQALSIKVKGDGQSNNVFIVLTDGKGEKHFVSSRTISRTDWQEIVFPFHHLFEVKHFGVISGMHWGGDGNQKLDLPVREITIGVEDKPDTRIGSGVVEFKELRFIR